MGYRDMQEWESRIAELEKGLEDYRKSPDYDEKEFQLRSFIVESSKRIKEKIEKEMQNPQKTNSEDAYLLPEYRSDGYFQSEDFDRKCEEFLQYLHDFEKQENRRLSREEINILKQHFMKSEYDLDWVPEEQQYKPGVIVIID